MSNIKHKGIWVIGIFLLVMFCTGYSGYWSYNYAAAHMNNNHMENALVVRGPEAELHILATVAEKLDTAGMNINQQLPVLKQEAECFGYQNMCIITPEGVLNSIQGDRINVEDRDYFKKALAGKPNVSTPFVSKMDGAVISMAAVPISQEGRIVGVLAGVLGCETPQGIANEAKHKQTGYACIIEQNGSYFYNAREMMD
ncbi:MAG: cache domain-containing protein [Syntrophomonadaceae bacterium]